MIRPKKVSKIWCSQIWSPQQLWVNTMAMRYGLSYRKTNGLTFCRNHTLARHWWLLLQKHTVNRITSSPALSFVPSLWGGGAGASNLMTDVGSNCSQMDSISLITLAAVGVIRKGFHLASLWAPGWETQSAWSSPWFMNSKTGIFKVVVCGLPSGRPDDCVIEHSSMC